ncbi:hypothetical protein EPJ65_10660 [Brachyspira aalborgi]|jgi:hypothetical protein|uniref:HNH endonuclease n=2 Tax=Brachyspira aalborgi TaxID=29522 RepID=A0AB38Q1I8_9SPIR|nr:hypothetical protein EPJ73_07275 [Brachyspira aalborgi]TXJ31238.1 hypothetical protein EPJ71_10940 [Brachyspira aalborgi]TXJ40624.1 hypothetical protein EPJ65_10660 [Brachyspira aalborgi]
MILKNLSYNFWDNKLMNIYKRIILFIALISFLLSCRNSPNLSININANHKNIKQQNIKYQNIKQQNIKYQNIKQQNVKYENIINEIKKLENTLKENVKLEYVIFEEYSKEDLEKKIKNKEYSDDFWQDVDWKSIIGKLTIGTSVIVVTGVFSVATIGSPLHIVFLSSFKGALAGAGIGLGTGAAINSAIQILLNGGKIDGWQKHALEGAADGYMWGAITGAITGGLKAYHDIPKMSGNYPKNPTVKFEWDIIKKGGKVYKGKFPVFKSKFEVKLPKNLWLESDAKQFTYAVNELKKDLVKNPILKMKFNKETLKAIENSQKGRIQGFTWHHHQKEGVLQLVDRTTHQANIPHKGGRAIWGGGNLHR